MSDLGTNIHILDAAYKPFPPFAEWAARTSVDTVRWDRYKAAIENRPDRSDAALKRAYEIVKRAAAIDTGAIEGLYDVDRGFTFTVALETAAWELELAKKGENVRSLFEAQLHAYDYVLDLATQSVPITEAAIRKLHEIVCEAQATYRVMTAVGPQEQELTKGRYKVLPNHVLTRDGVTHSYAPVDVTPAEMARLVNEMRTEPFLAAHPVIQAAYAHYGLVVIHPFADGNGRVARALASVFTYRAISIPIMILSDQKEAYLDALEAADGAGFQAFTEFMLARTADTMQLVDESRRAALLPGKEESLLAIHGLYLSRGGYTREQVDEAGRRAIVLLEKELKRSIERVRSAKVYGSASMNDGLVFVARPTRADELHVEGGRYVDVEFHSDHPVDAMVARRYDLFLPKNADAKDDIQIKQSDGDDQFTVRMDEIAGIASGVLQIRASLFAERIVADLLAELRSRAERRRGLRS